MRFLETLRAPFAFCPACGGEITTSGYRWEVMFNHMHETITYCCANENCSLSITINRSESAKQNVGEGEDTLDENK